MYMCRRISILLTVIALFTYGPVAMCQERVPACAAGAASAWQRPEGVSASDWSGIRAAYEAERHAVVAVEGGYQARNPGQAWQTRFDGCGFVTTPDSGGWS